MDPPATAQQAQPQQQQQQQRDTFGDTRNNRGNLSYFLFISMMFFFMSSNTPDTGAEQRYRNALSRLKMEREEFTDWLYPHTRKNETLNDGQNATMTSGITLAATSDVTASHVETPSASAAPGSDGNDNEEDKKPRKRDFVLQDLTPPPILADRVDRLIAPAFDNALYFHNISGFFKGSWLAHPNVNVTEEHANVTEVEQRQGIFPWTGRSKRAKQEDGKIVRLNVREAIPHVPGTKYEKEKKEAKVVLIRGTIDMQLHDMVDTTGSDDGEYKSNEIHMEGVQ